MTASPRHHTPRSDRPTRGGQVGKIAAAKGAALMPWQRDAVDVALEIDPATGLYYYDTVVVSVPRQAGKTKLEGDVADHRCLTRPRARVWFTAQSGKSADEWMREEHFTALRLATVFGVPGTSSCRYELSKRAGSVGVKWPALGSTFTTFPPRRDALHGKQGDLVFVDEAWVHNADAGADLRQAIRPTMNTRPGAQLWVVSTEGDDSSSYLEDYMTLGRASLEAPGSRVCFIDYGIPDDGDPDDIDLIAAHHPAYGHTLTRAALEAARADFKNDPAGWARAYGNRRTRTRETAIPAGLWADAATPRTPIPERAGIALDVTPDGQHYAIVAAWDTPAGRVVEVIASDTAGPGAAEQVARAAVRYAAGRLIVDRGSVGAVELVDAAARYSPDLDVVYTSSIEYAAACGSFYRGVLERTVRHSNDPDLDDAVEVAAKRSLLDGGFVWARKHSAGNIAPLVAASLALRAFDTLPAPRRRAVARA